MNRRQFVGVLPAAACGIAGFASQAAGGQSRTVARGRLTWLGEAEAIVNRIRLPSFPSRTILARDAGGVADGISDCRHIVQGVIDRLNSDGGGRLVLSDGRWRSNGPLRLKSNVRLHLEPGARLEFSGAPEHYLPVVLNRWEGTEVYSHSPLIYAYQAVNVAVTGAGVIDGNGGEVFDSWRAKQADDQQRIRTMGAESVPVHERTFGERHFLRPAMMQFFGCRDVLVEGVSLTDMPFWGIHPVYSQGVTIRDVRIDSRYVNSDGIDSDSSSDVLIERCTFQTGNDCIAIKSGRDQDGWRVGRASDGIVVRNCAMTGTSATFGAGVAIGSEMSGGIRNVYVHDCVMHVVPFALNIKSNLDRAGTVEHVRLGNCRVTRCNTLVQMTTAYTGYRGGRFPPAFRDIRVEHVECSRATLGFSVIGTLDAPIQQLTLDDIVIASADAPAEVKNVRVLRASGVRVGGSEIQMPSDMDL